MIRPAAALLAFAAAVASVTADGQNGKPAAPSRDTAWHLSWSDEFSGPGRSAPAASRWVYDLGGNGWGNNELETYTSRRENVFVRDGALVIRARRERFTGTDGIARDYTSARLKTLGTFSQKYGRFAARIKLPRGQGIWPAFWMLGDDIAAKGWPACGEIDIMENIGREPTLVHGTIHGPGYSGANGIGAPYANPRGNAFADAFHVFAIEWKPRELRWYVDDELYQTITPAQLPPGARWVYDHPFFVLLNVAVGGNWPGNPDASTTFPQEMVVDWIRVYGIAN